MRHLALIAALFFLSVAAAFGVSDESLEIRGVVSSFYKEYLACPDRPLVNFNQVDGSYASKLARMDESAALAEPEVGGLGFDPVAWAAEEGDSLEFEEPVVASTGAMATVVVSPAGKDVPSFRICVSLRLAEGQWRIIDTIDPEILGEKDCSSRIPGFLFPDIDFAHPLD